MRLGTNSSAAEINVKYFPGSQQRNIHPSCVPYPSPNATLYLDVIMYFNVQLLMYPREFYVPILFSYFTYSYGLRMIDENNFNELISFG